MDYNTIPDHFKKALSLYPNHSIHAIDLIMTARPGKIQLRYDRDYKNCYSAVVDADISPTNLIGTIDRMIKMGDSNAS